eukprot:Hpha_TRINITY_DN11989_c0_g1::TRINITY_DN11989_c0_g1_i1::g.20915::m.20915
MPSADRPVTAGDAVAVLKEQARLRGMKGWAALRKAELCAAIQKFDADRADGAPAKRKRDASESEDEGDEDSHASSDDDDSDDSDASSSSCEDPPAKKRRMKPAAKKATTAAAAKKASKKNQNWKTEVAPVAGAEYSEALFQIAGSRFFLSCDGVWDSESGERVWDSGESGFRAYSAEGDKVVTVDGVTVKITTIDTATGKAAGTAKELPIAPAFQKRREIYERVQLSRDGRKLALLKNKVFGFCDVASGTWESTWEVDADSEVAHGALLTDPATHEAYWFFRTKDKVGRKSFDVVAAYRSSSGITSALDDAGGWNLTAFFDPRSGCDRLVTAGGNTVRIHSVRFAPDGPHVSELKSITANHKNGVTTVAVDPATGILATGGGFDRAVYFWDAWEAETVRGRCVGKVQHLGDAFRGRYFGSCTKFHVQAIAPVTTDPGSPAFVTGNSNNADDACVKVVRLSPTSRAVARPLDRKTVKAKARAKKRRRSGGGGGRRRGGGCAIM